VGEQRQSEVDLAAELRRDLAVDVVPVVDQRPGEAFLVVDRAERAPDVRVVFGS